MAKMIKVVNIYTDWVTHQQPHKPVDSVRVTGGRAKIRMFGVNEGEFEVELNNDEWKLFFQLEEKILERFTKSLSDQINE